MLGEPVRDEPLPRLEGEQRSNVVPLQRPRPQRLTDLPAVRAYADRIGAEPRSLKKLAVTERRGRYCRDLAVIRFDADANGEVLLVARPPEFAPTDEEKAAIRREWRDWEWPEYCPQFFTAPGHPSPDDRRPWSKLPEADTFVFRDSKHERLLAVETRRGCADGGKDVHLWTPWSDGEWRIAEPPALPLYGLEQLGPTENEPHTIFLHEGPKAAAFCRKLIENDCETGWRAHPWGKELGGGSVDLSNAHRFPVRYVSHLGWPGGAMRADDVDLSPIERTRAKVIIVADRDDAGERAAEKIARRLRCERVFIMRLPPNFPTGFDLADPFPTWAFANVNGQRRFRGPCFEDTLTPAIWATYPVETGERGRPSFGIRKEFAATVAYTISPLAYLSAFRPGDILTDKEFNARFGPFSDVKHLAEKLHGELSCQYDTLVYRPNAFPGPLVQGRNRCWNVFEAPVIEPLTGDVRPWLDLLEHLFPDAYDRDHVCDWLATLFARPDIRMRYGLLLISETQGVGKGSLGTVVKLLVGEQNFSSISQNDVEGDFNSWAVRKRVAFWAEAYTGQSRKAYDKLKSYIADDDMPVNEKHVKQYRLDNWLHFIICSNSARAMHIDEGDRRFFVPMVREAKRSREAWDEFYGWLDGDGPGLIKQWALDRVRSGRVITTSAEPPATSRKAEIAAASRSEGQQLAYELGESLVEFFEAGRRLALPVSVVRRWLADRRDIQISDQRLEKPSTIVSTLKKVRGLTIWSDKLRPKIGGTRETVIFNFDPGHQQWSDLKAYLEMDLGSLVDAI